MYVCNRPVRARPSVHIVGESFDEGSNPGPVVDPGATLIMDPNSDPPGVEADREPNSVD